MNTQDSITIPTTQGLIAPVRSLTDSIMLPDGALLKAKNCTFMPNKLLSLWRPPFVKKNTLVEDPDNETVIAACADCGYLAFITANGTTYKQYLYKTDEITSQTISASARNTVSGSDANLDASVVFGGGYAYFAIEGSPVVLIKLDTFDIYYGGSACYTESGNDADYSFLPDGTIELTAVTFNKPTLLNTVTFFFARKEPKTTGKGQLWVYKNGGLEAKSTNVLYLGSLPDMISAQPTGETGYYPLTFELDNDVVVANGDVVSFKISFADVSYDSDGTVYAESGKNIKENLATITGRILHMHVNGVHFPKGGFCAYGQGRLFVAQNDGQVFSADPLFPCTFDGYVSTGLKLTGVYCYNREVVAFSQLKCSSITGVWPDNLEDVTEMPYGVNCQQGICYVEGSLFLGWGGILYQYRGQPVANPFIAEPSIKTYLNYYKRLNLLIMSFVNEGVHCVFQLNGLLATTWELSEISNGEIICLFGDYALCTDGNLYLLDFAASPDYETEVLTKGVNCGLLCEFDKVNVLSGCNGPGIVTLLFCSDCVDADSWTIGEDQLPYSQWEFVSCDFPQVYAQKKDECPVSFGKGILTPLDGATEFYRHPVNVFALKTTDSKTVPSGWAVAVNLKLNSDAPKSIGTLLGGFLVSVTSRKPRIGFAI